MGLVVADDGWRIPDEVWAQMEPLLPERPAHPLGCHNPRVPDREAMNAILLVLRTGMQWNALSATGICSCSSAYRRFREWAEAGVFLEFWRRGLLAYDDQTGIEWEWLALDGALGKAPLFSSNSGIGTGFFATQGRLSERAVQRQPLPFDPGLIVVGEQPPPPELEKDPRLGPLAEAPVGRRAGADPRRRERVPLHPRPQHEQDRVHRLPVGHTRVVTAERVCGPLRQERLHLRPHLVRDPPAIVCDHETHRLPPSSDDKGGLRRQALGPFLAE